MYHESCDPVGILIILDLAGLVWSTPNKDTLSTCHEGIQGMRRSDNSGCSKHRMTEMCKAVNELDYNLASGQG